MAKKLTEEQRKVWSHLNGKRYIPPDIREQYKWIKKLRSKSWKRALKRPAHSHTNIISNRPKSGKFDQIDQN